ncbi:hypothetical protein [Streptomyces sp. NPDC059918]|uniref:hypothetical protein n=1 Tax=unclassified Streptomyces TaxID=2593676 RepID=UPI00365930CA
MNARTTLVEWLGTLDAERLTALLEERDLPLAAEYREITTLRDLAEHLLTDASVCHGLMAGTAGELELLASVAALALERHGPVAGDEAEDGPRYPWQQRRPVVAVEPEDRLVPERDVLAWFEPGQERLRAEHTLARLRERALLLPTPEGKLALPPLLHVRAAGFDGYGRTADRLLTYAYNAPEIKRIAAKLFGEGAARTRDRAQELITALLADPARVRALVADAPARVRELLDHLVPGPPQLRTHCFVSRTGRSTPPPTPSTSSGRAAAETREPTGWPSADCWSPSAPTWWSFPTRSPARSATGARPPAPGWNRSRSPPPRRCRPAGRARGVRPRRRPPGGPNWPFGRWPPSRSRSASRAGSRYGTRGGWPRRPGPPRRTPGCGWTSR